MSDEMNKNSAVVIGIEFDNLFSTDLAMDDYTLCP